MGSYFSEDTIIAVATSLAGDGGVGVIRISGPAALQAAQEVTTGFEKPEPRYLHRITVQDYLSRQTLDDGMAVFFPHGHSFTGEDCVELQLHGGRYLIQTILRNIISAGKCRMALPGEFSFRAVRNGKMSLTDAQAIRQVIGAKSFFEISAARKQLGKQRTKDFEKIATEIRDLLARMELSIDFIEQDVEVISDKDLLSRLTAILSSIGTLKQQMNAASRIAAGVSVVITGRPNAGKSTLFNALLSEDRAIVSDEAGTTRDVITEQLSVGPYLIRLADTAGIRNTSGAVEQEGISRAKDLLSSADVIILLLDGTDGIESRQAQISEHSAYSDKLIVAINKSDLMANQAQDAVYISALQNEGTHDLLQAIRSKLDSRLGLGLDAFLPTEFQMQMLVHCENAVGDAFDVVRTSGQKNPEVISSLLHSAAKALTDIVGETTPDTILTKIFSEFCIGK